MEKLGKILGANSLSDVKKANRQLTYECIRKQKQITMTELERITQLSRPTIVGLVHEMEKEGLVLKVGYGKSSGGRSPVLYGANARAAFAMGVDFEFPAVRLAISDLDCNLIFSSISYYPVDADKDTVLKLLLEQIEDALQQSGIDRKKLLGMGVGMPGVIDYKKNRSVIFERIQGWEEVPLGDILGAYLQKPVYICNDVNLISLAERKLMIEEDIPDMLYIIMRTGIGMAIWNDGKLLQGENGNAGRLGHMMVNSHGPKCRCGSRGCLGLYTSARAMCNMYFQMKGVEVKKASELIALANKGDAVANQVLETSGQYLGIGIVNVANLFDISRVVVSASFDVSELMKHANVAIDNRERYVLRKKIDVRVGKLQEQKYGLGGCLLVLDKAYIDSESCFIL